MEYKIGVICGTSIGKHPSHPKKRKNLVDMLNQGDLMGIVLTPDTGGVGFSMVGANHVIFMGSMYSIDYESQATSKSSN
jgi:SNF2 family DNA or RNA helicase